MGYEYGLGGLQVGVGGHGGGAGGVGAIEDGFDPVGQQFLQSVDTGSYEQTEVGGDLFVAAASGVEFVGGVTD